MALVFNEIISTENLKENNSNKIASNPKIEFVKLDAFMYRSKNVICSDPINYKEKYTFPEGTDFFTVNDVIVNGTVHNVSEYDMGIQTVTVDFQCDISKDEIYFTISKIDEEVLDESAVRKVTIIDLVCDSLTSVGGNSNIVSTNSSFENTLDVKALIINGLYYIDNFTYTLENNKITIDASLNFEVSNTDKVSVLVYKEESVEEENIEE